MKRITVRFGDLPEGISLYYTFGWPSTLAEPENPGDLPTGIKARLKGRGATMLIMQ